MEFTVNDLEKLLHDLYDLFSVIRDNGLTDVYMRQVIKHCIQMVRIENFIEGQGICVFSMILIRPRQESDDDVIKLLEDRVSEINAIEIFSPLDDQWFNFTQTNNIWTLEIEHVDNRYDYYGVYRDYLGKIESRKQYADICDRMMRMEEMIKYIPGGIGFDEAKRHFEKASGQKSKTSSAKRIEGSS